MTRGGAAFAVLYALIRQEGRDIIDAFSAVWSMKQAADLASSSNILRVSSPLLTLTGQR